MSLLQHGSVGPEALSVASEAFSKACNFIEHDPMLASYEREKLQAELARGILDVVQTGERDLLQVTNRAIRRVRERILVLKEPPRVTQLTATSADLPRANAAGPNQQQESIGGGNLLGELGQPEASAQ